MEKISGIRTFSKNRKMKDHLKPTGKMFLTETELVECKGGFLILPYYLTEVALAADELLKKAINWLKTKH